MSEKKKVIASADMCACRILIDDWIKNVCEFSHNYAMKWMVIPVLKVSYTGKIRWGFYVSQVYVNMCMVHDW